MPVKSSGKPPPQIDVATVQDAVTDAVGKAFQREYRDHRRDLENYPPNMTVRQVHTYLNCSFQHVLNLVDAGALAAKDIAGPGASQRCLRIQRKDLADFLARNPAL